MFRMKDDILQALLGADGERMGFMGVSRQPHRYQGRAIWDRLTVGGKDIDSLTLELLDSTDTLGLCWESMGKRVAMRGNWDSSVGYCGFFFPSGRRHWTGPIGRIPGIMHPLLRWMLDVAYKDYGLLTPKSCLAACMIRCYFPRRGAMIPVRLCLSTRTGFLLSLSLTPKCRLYCMSCLSVVLSW